MPAEPADRLTLKGSRGGPLQVARIERDLASMWKSASTRTGGAPVSRACASTLVALDAGDTAGGDEWVGEISRQHPCRVIRVDSVKRGAAALTASAGAVCHLRSGVEGMICVEEIRIQVLQEALDRLPSVIRSLAIGGLPLVLFAPADRRNPAFPGVAADADVSIVDSWFAADLDLADSAQVRDLAWARGSSLRRALSQGLATAAGREVLDSLRQIRIDHGGRGPLPAAALLFAGWFAAELDLTPGRGAGREIRLAPKHRRGTGCSLTFHDSSGETEEPVGVHLQGDAGELEVRLLPGRVAATIRDIRSERRIALRRRSRAQRVIDEIHRHRPEAGYVEVLPLACGIARALED